MKIQNLKPEACYKMVVTDLVSARAMLRDVVKYLGMGFHPDNCGMDYVNNEGKRTFEKFEAEFLDANILNAMSFIDDIYYEGMNLWHEFGMLTTEEYENMMDFKKVDYQHELLDLVNAIVGEFVEEDDKYCCAVDIDVSTGDTVGVRWMEFDGFPTAMAANKRLHVELYRRTGRHFLMSHNSPTDGHVLIFVDKSMDLEYDLDHFKKSFIAQFEAWQNEGVKYDGPHAKAIIFQTLDDTISRDCMGGYWQDALQPNFDMWHQVMTFARNGISNPNARTSMLDDSDVN